MINQNPIINMKNRLEYLDIAKGIGVFLVLLGHLQGDKIFCYSPYILPMCEWIFSFHMALFFIVSGMLINYKSDISKDFKTTVKKRFKGIMIPYFWFSFFYMTVVIAALVKGTIAIDTLFINLWYVLSMYGMSVLWFLPTLFLAEILFIFIMKKLPDKKAVIIITCYTVVFLVFAALLWKGTFESEALKRLKEFITVIIRPFVASSFITIGYFSFNIINKSQKTETVGEETRFKGINVKELLIGIALMVIGASFVWINHGTDFRSLVFKNVPVYYLCAISSSIGLVLICKNIKPFKLLKFFGVNSLIFMAVHGSETIVYNATMLAMWANQYLTRARGYICYAIIVTFITVYVCIMILLINKFAPFIVGKPFNFKIKKLNN